MVFSEGTVIVFSPRPASTHQAEAKNREAEVSREHERARAAEVEAEKRELHKAGKFYDPPADEDKLWLIQDKLVRRLPKDPELDQIGGGLSSAKDDQVDPDAARQAALITIAMDVKTERLYVVLGPNGVDM